MLNILVIFTICPPTYQIHSSCPTNQTFEFSSTNKQANKQPQLNLACISEMLFSVGPAPESNHPTRGHTINKT